MRRTAVWKPISLVVASALAIGGVAAAPATAAPGDPAEARGQVLATDLLRGGLLTSGTSYASTSDRGPAANPLSLGSDLLGAQVQLAPGLTVPLIDDGSGTGLVSLGQLGALSSYASTPTDAASIAASGAITADGGLAVDPDPAPGTPPAANLDLTQALDQLGIASLTDQVVDELEVEVGALASRAEANRISGDSNAYAIADLRLEFHSPTVQELASTLTTSVGSTLTTLNTGLGALGGPTGTLQSAINALNISVDTSITGLPSLATLRATGATATFTLPSAATLVRNALDDDLSTPDIELIGARGLVINLTQGTVSADLAQLSGFGGDGLNGLAPNSELLSSTTVAALTQDVTTLLGGITADVATGIQTAIGQTSVVLSIPVSLTAAGLPVATATLASSTTLAALQAGTVVPTVTNVAVAGLPIPVATLTTRIGAAIAPVIGGAFRTVVNPLLSTSSTGVSRAVTALGTAATGAVTAFQPLFGALTRVVSLRANAQPTLQTPPRPSDLGPGGFTVSALEAQVLPGLVGSSLARVALGSSSVIAAEPDPAVAVTPGVVEAGQPITVDGQGYVCGPITVTIANAGGTTLATFPGITPDAVGAFEVPWTVPAGTPPGALTVTATASAGCGGTTTATVQVVAPTLAVDPTIAQAGGTIDVDGSGWAPSTALEVVVTDGAGAPVGDPIPVTTQADGSFTVPYATSDAAGALTFTATQGSATRAATAQVLAPTITATPDTQLPGGSVTLGGAGWLPGTPVTVTATATDGSTIGGPIAATVDTDGALVVAAPFTVPADIDVDTITFTATQGGASATVDVTVVPTATDPSITATPGTALPGDVIAVAGEGWTPGFPVTVVVTDADGVERGTVELDPDGDGAVALPDGFAIPAETAEGDLTFAATQGEASDDAIVDVGATAAAPTLEATPPAVQPGDAVALAGGGWTPGFPVTIVATSGGTPVGDPIAADVLPDGTLDADVLVVPDDAPSGDLVLTATQGLATATDAVTVAPTAATPTLAVDPTTAQPGAEVALSGDGWTPGFPVTIVATDADGAPIGDPITATVGDGGVLEPTGPFTVPDDETGTITFTATQGLATASADLTVAPTADEPTLEASPASVLPGAEVTLAGGGWTPGFVVTITAVDDADEPVSAPIVATVGDDGALVLPSTFTVPDDVAAPGELAFTAAQGLATASDVVAVAPTAAAPTLAVDPTTAQPGTEVALSGDGWTPGFPVTIVATDADGAPIGDPITATVGDGGALELADPFTVPDDATGTIVFTATQGLADATAELAVAPTAAAPTLAVDPTTAQPGAEVALSGDGWTPGFPVTIVATDADGAPIGDPITATVTAGGVLEIPDPFVVPDDATGTITFTATQGLATASADLAIAPTAAEPTVVASPASVLPGAEVTLTGGGWTPGFPVVIVATDAEGTSVGDPVVAPVDVEGSLDAPPPFTVPADVETPGTLTFTATQGLAEATDDVAVAPTAIDATLDAAPATVLPGDEIVLTGADWTPGFPVSIVASDASGPIGDPIAATVADDGALVVDAPFVVPADIDAPATISFAATQGLDTATDDVAVSPTAAAPELTADPGTVQPGGSVTLGGAGWTPGFDVAIVATDASGAPVGEPVPATVADDGTLVVDAPFAVPSDLAAPTTLTFTATQGLASTTAQVAIAPTAATPTLTATPDAVLPGDAVTLAGGGWTFGFPVSIVMTDASGAPVGDAVPATVASDGTLVVDAPFTVPSDVATPTTLTATATQGLATATAAVEVSPTATDPTLDADPATVLPGAEVTLTGTGWTPGFPVSIVATDASGTPIGDPVPATVTDDGDLVVDGTWIVPDDADAPGTIAFTATQGLAEATDDVAVSPTATEPTLAAAPATALPGDAIALTGDGWTPGFPVTIVATDASGAPIGDPVPATVDDDGSLLVEDPWTVPSGIAAPGTVTFTATQGEATATAAVSVLPTASDPTIDASPASALPGDDVAVTGAGWTPGLPVTVAVTDGGGTELGTVEVEAADDGSIALPEPFAIPADVAAPTVLTFTGTQGEAEADDTVDVAPTADDAALVATPGAVLPGQQVVLSGTGWTPGFPVTIVATDAGGAPVGDPIVATVDDDGDLVLDGPFTVPPDAVGAIAFAATQGLATAGAEVTVAPTALDPSLSLAPPVAEPGDEVTVGGGGWTPGFPVRIVVTDPAGTVIAELEQTPGDDGTLPGAPFTVPDDVTGDLTVTGTQGGASATATLPVQVPAIAISRTPTTPGTEVTVSGSEFSCGPVDVEVLAEETVLLSQTGIAVQPDGTWSWTTTLPDDLDAGTLVVRATTVAPCDESAEAELEVRVPTHLAVQDVVRVGEVVELQGADWLPDAPIVIEARQADDTLVGTITLAPSGMVAAAAGDASGVHVDGAYDFSWTVPQGTALGLLTFTATQGDVSGSDVVRVIGTPRVNIVVPGPVTPGTDIVLAGDGFSCGPVTISVHDADGTRVDSTAPIPLVDSGFDVTWRVPADLDPTTLTVTVTAPPECDERASASVEVVAPGSPGAPGSGSGSGGGGLPRTGDEVALGLAALATLLLLAGATLRMTARRRRTQG